MQSRAKLHPSSCFPPNPAVPTTQNRLFIRNAPIQARNDSPRLTFIGINSTAYSSIAALLAQRPSTSIERIQLLDSGQKLDARATLHDLQVVASMNDSNIRLEWVCSYWETKDSSIIIINVQHNQLEDESVWTWIQKNTSLVESVVSQACRYSPRATLVVCTQPNELMTYVGFRASKFPSERVFGLGASADTAYAHQTILRQTGPVHGRINGLFVLGNGLGADACATTLTDHLTVDGIGCTDLFSKPVSNRVQNACIAKRLKSKTDKANEWNLINLLHNHYTLHSNAQRQLPMNSDLITRQKTVTKYLLPTATNGPTNLQPSRSLTTPSRLKSRSNWTEAMIIARLARALLNGCEFQSNFVVNIASIHHSKNIFINYPTIIGSRPRSIEYMLPFRRAQDILTQRASLVPYEKLQNKLRLCE